MSSVARFSSSDIVLSHFLSKHTDRERKDLLRFLPRNEREHLETLVKIPRQDKLASHKSLLEEVHWSWFLPTLKAYSPVEQSLFLTIFDTKTSQALAEEVPCKRTSVQTTAIGKLYLKQVLIDSLLGEHATLLPIDFLPVSSLNELIRLSKKKLTDIIELIAMHDLAIELRQIVDTKRLKTIFSFLSDQQRQFLQIVASRHEVLPLVKVGLDRWDGTKEMLRHLIHRRGLTRFGVALSAQDPSLCWYICHRLDIGRGTLLFRLCQQETLESITEGTKLQVEEVLNFMEKD